MKVIFLDIDGVLNADDDCIFQHGPKKGEMKTRFPHVQVGYFQRYIGISNKKVKRLAHIVQETGAILVLISSWKDGYERFLQTKRDRVGRYLFNKLFQQGLTIHSTTLKQENIDNPSGSYQKYVRGMGIQRWLKEHEGEIECWIALDDISYDYLPDQRPRICQTCPFCINTTTAGLNDDIMNKAIKMLKEENIDN